MKFLDTIAKKLIAAVVGIALAITVVSMSAIIKQRTAMVEEQVNQQVFIATNDSAGKIKDFLAQRSRVVTTLAATPFLSDWFAAYDQRGSDISGDQAYLNIVSMFKAISAQDPVIKSVFYAPANTFEYFDISGRYNNLEYFTNKRPWWFEALEKNTLFITQPQIDANDKSIVSSIKTTVRAADNSLIGVVGVDILATQIKRDLIDKLNYGGQGTGFLFTSKGDLIALNDNSGAIDMSTLPTLSQLDGILNDASGFSNVLNVANSQAFAQSQVTYQGEVQRVYTQQINDPSFGLDWRIGFVIPESVISAPIKATTYSSIFNATAILLLCGGLMMFFTNRIVTKPLDQIGEAMDNIAVGEGDLTQRLDESRSDELGKLSRSFNAFVANIHSAMSATRDASDEVSEQSRETKELSVGFSETIDHQKEYIEQIAAASTEMSQTISGVADNAQNARSLANEANMHAKQGQDLVSDANRLMGELHNDVKQSEQVVTVLNDNAASISSVLEVIKGVAEQTNLLALNAAIEAARAGEQGRGFAVVADEVRTLASRTQDSTVDIEAIIAKLQQSAGDAVESMQVGRDKAEKGVVMIGEVDTKLQEITNAVSRIDEQSQEIASMMGEQSLASNEISQQTVSVQDLSESSVANTSQIASKLDQQQAVIDQLHGQIARFKL